MLFGQAELIYRHDIYNEIVNRIREYNPEVTERQSNIIKNGLWLIFDGINSHNGEKTESEFVPDTAKNQAQFKKELMRCFIEKGFDKTIMPATIEGCTIRLCDKIAYIPYDMLDGLREGIIEKLDGEYIPVLTSLGITEEEINECNITRNYESIARKLVIIFTKDTIRNSTKQKIKMSPEISKLMHQLRDINNREIVDYVVLQEDNETYSKAIRILMEDMSEILLEDDNTLDEMQNANTNLKLARKMIAKYEGTPYEGFAKYIVGVNPVEYEFTKNMVERASMQARKDEINRAGKAVFSREDFSISSDFPNRDARIKMYIEGIKNGRNLDEVSKEAEVDPRKKLALEFGAKYLSTLNDFEFFDLIKRAGIINRTQAKSLTRTYREIGREELKRELYELDEWKTIKEEQRAEIAKMDNLESKSSAEGPEL